MTNLAPPPAASEVGQPEWRAAVLAEAIRHTAHLTGPINPFSLMDHLRNWLGLVEEECGADLHDVLFMMVGSGLYTSNTMDFSTGTVWLGSKTYLTAGRALTAFVYSEEPAEREDDEI
jgi:hypothetical protein